ncbi:unnamed protein product, partial [Polarella glacialis]
MAVVVESTYCDVDVSFVLSQSSPSPSTGASGPPSHKSWLRSGAWSPSRALVEIDRVHLAVSSEASAAPEESESTSAAQAVRCVSLRVDGELDLD